MDTTMNTATTTRNTQRVGVLANLLATENLKVVHSASNTSAAFDLATRTLHLPMWQVTPVVYDFLVGHEIAHAKYTPTVRWKTAAEEIGGTKNARVAQDFINVIEDARIERMIKREFPGLRKDFIEGYKILHEEMDIFRVKGRDLSTLRLVDRINLYYKVGIHCGIQIPFTAEERVFLDRINATRTGEVGFEDVVEIARDLYAHEREMKRNEEQQEQSAPSNDKSKKQKQEQTEQDQTASASDDAEGDEDQDTDAQGNGGKDGEETDESESNGTDESSEDDTDDGESAESKTAEDSSDEDSEGSEESVEEMEAKESKIDPDAAETVGAMSKGIASMVNASYDEETIMIHDIDPSKVVIDVAEFVSLCDKKIIGTTSDINIAIKNAGGMSAWLDAVAIKEFNRVIDENKRGIDAMCKRFEVKRAAKNFAKQSSAKSGRISTRLLSKYKFSEDIFDRVVIKRDEKNHGIVILLDWSGSMGSMIVETVNQIAALLVFCRKCGIPAEVYFFNSCHVPFCDELFAKSGAAAVKGTNRAAYSRSWSSADDVTRESHQFTDHVCNLPKGSTAKGGHAILQPFSLMQVYTQNMDNRKFQKSIGRLIVLAHLNGGRWSSMNRDVQNLSADPCLMLGNTPLDESILAMRPIIENFRKSSNAKVTFINLSDGDGTSVVHRYEQVGRKVESGSGIRLSRTLIDDRSGRRMNVDREFGARAHSHMIQLLKDYTNVQVVGIYMTQDSSIGYSGALSRALHTPQFTITDKQHFGSLNEAGLKYRETVLKAYETEKFVALTIPSYDTYFVVQITDRDRARREAENMERKTSTLKNQKVAATRNFIANMKQEQTNRMFINRLMDIIA
jgi:hypothetical protein